MSQSPHPSPLEPRAPLNSRAPLKPRAPLPFAGLPRQRFSLRGMVGFTLLYLVGFLFCQRFVWRPRDQGLTKEQQTALASAPDSQRWLWQCGETTGDIDVQVNDLSKGQAPPFDLGWGSSITLHVQDRETMRALLRALAATGPFVPVSNAQKKLPNPPGCVWIVVSREVLCLATGKNGPTLTWQEANERASLTPQAVKRFVRAVREATDRARHRENDSFLLDTSMEGEPNS